MIVPAILAACFGLIVPVERAAAVAQVHGDSLEESEEPGEKPGLVGEFSDGRSRALRSGVLIALNLNASQSAHPAVRPEDLSVVWRGAIRVKRPGRYRFAASVIGEFSLSVNQQVILRVSKAQHSDSGLRWSEPFELQVGSVPVEARYTKTKSGPALLALAWKLEGMPAEPIGFPDLVHSQAAREAIAPFDEVEQGRRLVARLGCVVCHATDDRTRDHLALQPNLAPDLDDLQNRVFRSWLSRWLQDPHAFRPTTAMPRLFGDEVDERTDLAALVAFLLPQRLKHEKADPIPTREQVAKGAESFSKTGCTACHTALGDHPRSLLDLVSLDGLASKGSRSAMRRRLLNPYEHHLDSGMPDFDFRNRNRLLLEPLLDYLMSGHQGVAPDSAGASEDDRIKSLRMIPEQAHSVRQPTTALDLGVDPSQLGRAVLAKRRCLNCHSLSGAIAPVPPGAPLKRLFAAVASAKEGTGCLESTPRRGLPDFALTPTDRQNIGAFLRFLDTHVDTWESPDFLFVDRIDRLRCASCHSFCGKEAGFALRTSQSSRERGIVGTTQSVPDLTDVARRLQPDYLRRVLLEGSRCRPWLEVKMPQYSARQLRNLAEGFLAFTPDVPEQRFMEASRPPVAEVEIGRVLIGASGFNCVNCHDWKDRAGTGTRAPDLATASKRLRGSWCRRWLADPQRISPGTRMPTFFPNGRSMLPNYAGGDALRQMDAIWSYLSQSDVLAPPLLVLPQNTVAGGETNRPVPTSDPLLAHGFMTDDAGLRAIAAGFSSKIHFAFDADQCRLTRAWHGDFIEIGDWFGSGRGTPIENGLRILGTVFWQSPSAPTFLLGESNRSAVSTLSLAHPIAARLAAHWRKADRVGFEYSLEFYGGRRLMVQEQVFPLVSSVGPAFCRRIDFGTSHSEETVWLCLATGLSEFQVTAVNLRGKSIEGRRNDGGITLFELGAGAVLDLQMEGKRWLYHAAHCSASTRAIVVTEDQQTSPGQTMQRGQAWIGIPLTGEPRNRTCDIVLCSPTKPVGKAALDTFVREVRVEGTVGRLAQ